jgi:NAD(P)H dehydrogenase (quinone)
MMADAIAEGIKKEAVKAEVRKVQDVKANDLLKFDGIVIGSPTYYGSMAAQIKQLLDESVKFHGELDGKIGAAFSSSANIGGGNETTILDILNAMLIHGMIIQGDPQGDHYGAVSINLPDSRATKQCMRMGERIGKLVKRSVG